MNICDLKSSPQIGKTFEFWGAQGGTLGPQCPHTWDSLDSRESRGLSLVLGLTKILREFVKFQT